MHRYQDEEQIATTQGPGSYFPACGEMRGAILLAHGLNQCPESWLEMRTFLQGLGFGIYILQLSGHRGRGLEEMRAVTAERWLAEFAEASRIVRLYGGAQPVHLVGYSLGGLLGQAVQLAAGRQLFDRQLLLAPALAIRPYTRLSLPLSWLCGVLPSRSPVWYRANSRGITHAAYRALFAVNDTFWEWFADNHERVANLPTLVLMHPADELISSSATRRLTEQLVAWQYQPLTGGRTMGELLRYRHLLVDSKSFGDRGWRVFTSLAQRFLLDPSPVPDLCLSSSRRPGRGR